MAVVYFLLTHKNANQIDRLVRRLLSGGDSFVLIHHDAKSGPLALSARGNLHVLEDPVEVRWSRISGIHAMMKAFSWLESARLQFDWLIFISGQDYPIRPPADIDAELRNSTVDAYLHHEVIHEDPAFHRRAFHEVCWRRYFLRRVKVPGTRPFYFKRRHPYRRGMQCFAGSAWLNLSRRAFEHLCSKRGTISMLTKYLRRAPVPDETLFHTVLMNDSNLKVENTDKRFIVWEEQADSPKTLDLQDLDAILASDAWFARKLDEHVCPELFDRLDEVILRQRVGC